MRRIFWGHLFLGLFFSLLGLWGATQYVAHAFGYQKALGAPPGLATVSVSERGWQAMPEEADIPSWYLNLRTWAFIFCFLSIGLTTRFKELKAAGVKPFLSFTVGVLVNVALGFILSVYVFGNYWMNLGK